MCGTSRAFGLNRQQPAGTPEDSPLPPLKTIAVTPNKRGGARKRAAAADESDDIGVSLSPLASRPRRTTPAPQHRYQVGESLRMNGGGYSVARQAAGCKVVAILPYEGHGALLYRVRSDTESFERVVSEADLAR